MHQGAAAGRRGLVIATSVYVGAVDDRHRYAADKENHRVQVFDSNGRFETQWINLHRPCALYISEEQHVYIGELGPGMSVNRDVPNIGPRITVMNTKGERLARIGHLGLGEDVGQFIAPHSISVDSRGDIYLGEVSWTYFNKNLGEPKEHVRSFQKLVKVKVS